MKISGPIDHNPYFVAMLSVVLFVGSWPAIGSFAPLIFFALVPLLLAQWSVAEGIWSFRETLCATVLAFFGWNAGTLYFLFLIDDHIGIRLLAFLTPVLINTTWMTLLMLLFGRVLKRRGMLFSLAVFITSWLGVEWLQHHWILAFPWLTLGNVMGPHPSFVQWYSYTGVAGGSLWVLLANMTVFVAIAADRKWWIAALAIGVFPLLQKSGQTDYRAESSQRFTIVQPSLDSATEKFEIELMENHLKRSFALVNAVRDSAGVVVFPETFLYEPARVSGPSDDLLFEGLWMHAPHTSVAVKKMQHLLRDPSVDGVITGAFSRKVYTPDEVAPAYANTISGLGAQTVNYNSALIIDSSGFEWRHKRMLVTGVEEIPFASTIPALNLLALDLGGVVGSLGKQKELLPTKAGNSSAGVQICYDSAFGWVSAELCRAGADVLVILTNDSWWGDSPGYRQLLSFAQLRAIETGRSVVRSANNGISGFITPEGKIAEYIPWNEEAAISANVELRQYQTFYVCNGDLIYRGAVLLLPLILLWMWRSGNSSNSDENRSVK